MYVCVHTCIHAYMHTCIHAYMHTCIHAYMHTCHRCQPQRTKKPDRADEKALKAGVSIFSHHQGAHLVKQPAKHTPFYKNIHDPIKWCSCITKYTVSESLMSLFVSCNDIVADIAEPISFAEHGKLVSESSEFHLTLSRAHKAHFFSTRNTPKKSGTF